MFLVSDENMVVAASEAGGIGSFPALNFRPIENYRKAIRGIKSRTKNPIGVNVIVQSSNKYQDQHIDIALDEGVELIVSSLGNPRQLIQRARRTSTKVFCDIVRLDHAQKAADAGADGLIAVSSGAGGHAGDISPFALIPYIKRRVPLPLIAAGSIVDGATMAAAFALGADGIYMGTRFIASKESPVELKYKQAILDAPPERIVNTDRVDGFPGNFILTPELEELGIRPGLAESLLRQSKKLNRMLSVYRAGRALLGNPNRKGSYKTIFSAGQGVGLITDLPSISEIFERTIREYEHIKQGLP